MSGLRGHGAILYELNTVKMAVGSSGIEYQLIFELLK